MNSGHIIVQFNMTYPYLVVLNAWSRNALYGKRHIYILYPLSLITLSNEKRQNTLIKRTLALT